MSLNHHHLGVYPRSSLAYPSVYFYTVGEDCRDKWKYLRTKYSRERKEAKEKKSGSAGGCKSQWKYLNILSFLEPYVQDRVTVSNFDSAGTAETAECILNAICESNEVRVDEIEIMYHN